MTKFCIITICSLQLVLSINEVSAQQNQQEREPPPTRVFGRTEQIPVSQLQEWDIILTAKNIGFEPFPVVLTLNLESFSSCEIQSVRMGILNPEGPSGVFLGVLAGRNSRYEFRTSRQFLPMTTMFLLCGREPDTESTDLGVIQVMLDEMEIEAR